MKNLMLATKNFLKGEEGVTAIEYGLIAALIAVAIVVALGAIGTDLNTVFETVSEKLGVPAGG